LPYCRKCGTPLEDNAKICYKCGTPVDTFTYASYTPPINRPTKKEPIWIYGIILIAILLSAVVIAAIIFMPFKPFSFGQTNEIDQPNVNTLNLNFQANNAQVIIMTQNPTNGSVAFYTSGSGSVGILNSKMPVDITVTNQTSGSTLTVNAKISTSSFFGNVANVKCEIWLDPSMFLNLNVTTETGQVTLIANQSATFGSLNLKSTTGLVQANIGKDIVFADNVSLKTSTGEVMFNMNGANVNGNHTFNLQTNTGKVDIKIEENQTLLGNVQLNASTGTGEVDLSMNIDNGVGARIESKTNIGSINTNANNFSGTKSPIESNNYPAQSNFLISLKTNIGSININATYQSESTSSTRN